MLKRNWSPIRSSIVRRLLEKIVFVVFSQTVDLLSTWLAGAVLFTLKWNGIIQYVTPDDHLRIGFIIFAVIYVVIASMMGLYRSNYNDELVVEFAKNFPLFGITMWYSRALTDLPLKLSQNNVRVFAHTVNDTSLRSKLLINGVYGVYTDFLNPEIN